MKSTSIERSNSIVLSAWIGEAINHNSASGGVTTLWVGRLISFMAAAFRNREEPFSTMSPSELFEFVKLDRLCELCRREPGREDLAAYLKSLPGFKNEFIDPRSSEPISIHGNEVPFEQHGFLSMILVRGADFWMRQAADLALEIERLLPGEPASSFAVPCSELAEKAKALREAAELGDAILGLPHSIRPSKKQDKTL